MDYETNSPYQHLRECIGNGMENMHTDFRLERVKSLSAPHCFLYVFYESILSASDVFNMHDVLFCKTSFDVILL